ncbi:hypothetical protein T484DRAFT_1807511 [Baffinella frigidus]|nr:hypothetical protein T484DRAFT_1807511 [Cryptophyta sp. CCMP2293]
MIITKENEVPDGLYIVRHGDVDIFQKATYLFSAGPGDIFGENAILGLSTDGKRSRKAIASKNTELCFLSSDSIRHLILDFPSFDLNTELWFISSDSIRHLILSTSRPSTW